MDKIYSRHRIKIYKFKPNNTRRKTAYKKTIKLGTILLIAFLTVYTILKSLNPTHADRSFAPQDVAWMARVLWVSQ